MELFDFIRIIFERPGEYARLSRYEKSKHFFMTNRFMSISFPMVASAFNHIRISQPEVMDYWHNSLIKLYVKVPGWIYCKTSKKGKKEKVPMPSKEAMEYYLGKMSMSRRDLDDAIRMFGPDVLAPIRRIDKAMTDK